MRTRPCAHAAAADAATLNVTKAYFPRNVTAEAEPNGARAAFSASTFAGQGYT